MEHAEKGPEGWGLEEGRKEEEEKRLGGLEAEYCEMLIQSISVFLHQIYEDDALRPAKDFEQ